jgi:hypothetical protein
MSAEREYAEKMLADFERLQAERAANGWEAKKVAIVVRRKSPPMGRQVRTIFGMGEIACCHEDGRVVAYVDLARAIGVLRRALAGSGR